MGLKLQLNLALSKRLEGLLNILLKLKRKVKFKKTSLIAIGAVW